MHRASPTFALVLLTLLAAIFRGNTAPAATLSDREAAHFARCSSAVRITCVVDGDTFWYRGAKIRLADVNAPETRKPRCAAEARLGRRAARRLTELLNAGAFSLEAGERAEDIYGRKLFTVSRGGASLAAALEAEGLSAPWRGRRHSWC